MAISLSVIFRALDTVAAWQWKGRNARGMAAGHVGLTVPTLGNWSPHRIYTQGIQDMSDSLYVHYKWYIQKYLTMNLKGKKPNVTLLLRIPSCWLTQFTALCSLLSISSLKYSFDQRERERDPASDFISLW